MSRSSLSRSSSLLWHHHTEPLESLRVSNMELMWRGWDLQQGQHGLRERKRITNSCHLSKDRYFSGMQITRQDERPFSSPHLSLTISFDSFLSRGTYRRANWNVQQISLDKWESREYITLEIFHSHTGWIDLTVAESDIISDIFDVSGSTWEGGRIGPQKEEQHFQWFTCDWCPATIWLWQCHLTTSNFHIHGRQSSGECRTTRFWSQHFWTPTSFIVLFLVIVFFLSFSFIFFLSLSFF
jgi:hypothetical protein